jgi:FkbH-like protein
MSSTPWRGVVLSDFNAAPLFSFLRGDAGWPAVEAIETEFGAVERLLLDAEADAWHEKPDFAVVWTQPHRTIDAFRRLVAGEPVTAAEAVAEVDRFADLVLGLEGRTRFVLVPLWFLPPDRRVLSVAGLASPDGEARVLAAMNFRLAERLESAAGFVALDAPAWAATVGRDAFRSNLWYLGKIPYSNDLFRVAAGGVKSALRGLAGHSRKLVVLDLDDTLWGGIVGDDGKEGLRLGGHDPVGEAYADFQAALKALTRRGILLGIVSKNEEETALDAIRTHPEMALSLDDFAAWRINWNDKARNVADVVAEVNVGLDAAVFLDDNPVERARVREALPDVLVPEWPDDPAEYVRALLALDCFDPPSLSQEDRARAAMMAAGRKRDAARATFENLDEWLRSLGTVVTCEVLHDANLPRAAQLMNKTNQMNMTTRRMTEDELRAWAEADGNAVWTFRVRDKMGDLGLTGIASLAVDGDRATVADFILSCRVMGRKVEETMVATVVEAARAAGVAEVLAQPIPTKKNAPCRRFWRESAFERDEDDGPYRWPTSREFPVPDSVTREGEG